MDHSSTSGSNDEKRTSTSGASRGWYLVQLLAALAGAAISLYLLVQHTRVKSGIQDAASFCNFGSWANCDVVNASRWSEVGGIPLAAIGALFYFVLLLLVSLARPSGAAFPRTQRLLGLLSIGALVVDIGLGAVQLFILKSACVMCLSTYLATLLVFVAAVRLRGGLGPLLGAPLQGPWPLPAAFAAATVALLGMLVALWAVPASIRGQAAEVDKANEERIQAFYASLKTTPSRPLPIGPGDGIFGNPQAKVQLVEFSDFQCPFCRRAAFRLHYLLEPYKDRIYFVFKHFPLDDTCNRRMPRQLHAHACWAAQLTACAQRDGRFWKVHDQLFLKMTDEDFEKGREHLTTAVAPAISVEEQKKCLADPAALSAVTEDIEQGHTLEIHGTPALFVNGKAMAIPLTPDTLRKTIEIEEALAK